MQNLNVVGVPSEAPRPQETSSKPIRTEESSFKRHFDSQIDQGQSKSQDKSQAAGQVPIKHEAQAGAAASPSKLRGTDHETADQRREQGGIVGGTKASVQPASAVTEQNGGQIQLNPLSDEVLAVSDLVDVSSGVDDSLNLSGLDSSNYFSPQSPHSVDAALASQGHLSKLTSRTELPVAELTAPEPLSTDLSSKLSSVELSSAGLSATGLSATGLSATEQGLASQTFLSQPVSTQSTLATTLPPLRNGVLSLAASKSVFTDGVHGGGHAEDLGSVLASKAASLSTSTYSVAAPTFSPASTSSVDSIDALSQQVLGTQEGKMKTVEYSSNLGLMNSSLAPSELPSSLSSVSSLTEQVDALAPSNLSDRSMGAQSLSQASSPARFFVNVEFGRSEWNSNVAAKVAQMAAQNLKHAEIQLDPPELGPLQVRVQVNTDQASVSFTAQSAQVRDALEQGSQRLRDLFEAEGMNLVDVDVSDQQQGNDQNPDDLDSQNAQGSSVENRDESFDEQEAKSTVMQAGVDHFV